MTDFDRAMKDLLSEADTEFIGDTIDETGYYKTVFSSLRGQGQSMSRLAWCGIIIFGGLLILCIWQMIIAEDLRLQLFWGVFAILTNSAQIALKLWFNMQLNRRALSHEIRKLQLAVMAKS
jgi:hypothetical protein